MITPHASLFALVLVACASSSPKPSDAEKVDDFADIAWGSQPAVIEQRFPGAVANEHGLAVMGTFVGRAASLRFYLGDQGLTGIGVQFQTEYASMDACGVDFAAIRRDMNAVYGRSQADNLAAYWDQETREIQLSCDPGDDGTAMTVSFRPPDPE